MSAITSTLGAFQQGVDRAATRIEAELRAVAQRTAGRVKSGVVARMREATGKMKASVHVVEEADKRQFRVEAADVPGRNPMVPVWHEFGTSKMPAQPAFGPALEEVRADYAREGEAACAKAAEALS